MPFDYFYGRDDAHQPLEKAEKKIGTVREQQRFYASLKLPCAKTASS